MTNEFMKQAVELARRGKGNTQTNPCVGAVIVKDNIVVGSGWHMYYGGPHAEVNALLSAEKHTSGADLYVTLEPCCTYGRTPPCTEAIIAAGIKRVFIGVLDPNPNHSGRAVNILKNAGIEVFWGYEKEKCATLIADFSKFITTKIPFVTMKVAQSIDGKIATSSGESKWITSEDSRNRVHDLRRYSDAVLVGIGTVLSDDPELTVRRGAIQKQPLRVVLDSQCRIPLTSKLVQGAANRVAGLVIFTTIAAEQSKIDTLRSMGVEVITIGETIQITDVLKVLGELNVMNVFVEGGSTIFGSFVDSGCVDEFHFFIAPMIIGGDNSKNSIGGAGALALADAMTFKNFVYQRSGKDLWVYSRASDYVTPVMALTINYETEYKGNYAEYKHIL